jgi:hypothetical protein
MQMATFVMNLRALTDKSSVESGGDIHASGLQRKEQSCYEPWKLEDSHFQTEERFEQRYDVLVHD